MINRLSILLVFILLLSACDSEPRARQAKFYAFGTEIDVSLYNVDEDTATSTVALLEASFDNSNQLWHAWRPSVLSDINLAISEGKTIAVDDDVAALINLAKTLATQSNNLFNPAAGKLFELWGFHQDAWFESHPPPEQALINHWLAADVAMDQVQLNKGQLSSSNTMVKLGFGGFAKGFAVDAAIQTLQQQGIENAIVNIGGDLRAIGSHGDRPWVIGIRHPRRDGMLASIALRGDESVFTSGDYERFFEFKGQRYSHIIDPRTGWPADNARSATVLHNNASIADAAATALFVAGDDWPTIAAKMNIDYVMLVRVDGKVEMSPLMAKRARLMTSSDTAIIRPIKSEDSH